jgi:hypothetical protein
MQGQLVLLNIHYDAPIDSPPNCAKLEFLPEVCPL